MLKIMDIFRFALAIILTLTMMVVFLLLVKECISHHPYSYYDGRFPFTSKRRPKTKRKKESVILKNRK
jgi:hypothetical protein